MFGSLLEWSYHKRSSLWRFKVGRCGLQCSPGFSVDSFFPLVFYRLVLVHCFSSKIWHNEWVEWVHTERETHLWSMCFENMALTTNCSVRFVHTALNFCKWGCHYLNFSGVIACSTVHHFFSGALVGSRNIFFHIFFPIGF